MPGSGFGAWGSGILVEVASADETNRDRRDGRSLLEHQ